MSKKYILALDQGTSSSRSILFDKDFEPIYVEHEELKSIFPQSGYVEQDPEQIWNTQLQTINKLLKISNVSPSEIAAIGITNQRETTIIWDKKTGKPIYNAIVWQDSRTSEYCESIKEKGLGKEIKEKTGLIPDSYFSATKIQWILDNVKGARQQANKGELLFGTVDTWLLWKLSKGKYHYTDVSNASRTMLFDINLLDWSKDLMELFNIPASTLPEVKESSTNFGTTDSSYFGVEIPVNSLVGDQQSALFGQRCINPGDVKNTYGTGCFMLMNTGDKPVNSKFGLLSTIAWSRNNKVVYALEGSVFIAGAVIQWLRDGLGILEKSSDSEQIAKEIGSNNEVYFVPAFAGLGAPYWNMEARGAIIGLTRSTTSDHIIRAGLESMAFQTKDVLNAMINDSGINFSELKVDGGASENNFIMQFQSDILNKSIARPGFVETTALGAALFAGLSVGFWAESDLENINFNIDVYKPEMSLKERTSLYKGWQNAIKKVVS